MTLKKYERVMGVVVKPSAICTLEGVTALNGVTILLPTMTTLYEAADIEAVLKDVQAALTTFRTARTEAQFSLAMIQADRLLAQLKGTT